MNKKWLSLVVLMILLLTLPAVISGEEQSQAQYHEQEAFHDRTAGTTGYPTDQIIIKFREPEATAVSLTQNQEMLLARLSNVAGLPLEYFRPMSGDAHVLKLPRRLPLEDVELTSKALSALPEVAYAEPDRILQIVDGLQSVGETTNIVPNDPNFNYQWHYGYTANTAEGINLLPAWDITTGISTTVVAVIDTGILPHVDLSGRTVDGYDFISDVFMANDGDGRDSDPADPGDWVGKNDCGFNDPRSSSWHGTHVAGTIGAASNNGLGVAGVNWQAKILPVRVLGKCGGVTSDILDGARWAAGLSVDGVSDNPNPAQVLNLSLGGFGSCSTAQQEAINDIVAAGTTLVIAAGNSNMDAGFFNPANCDDVITVAANDRTGDRAFYSNYGSLIEVAAPGGETNVNGANGVLSTLNDGSQGPANDSYAYYQGTSMAAPHVAGVASLVLAMRPDFTPAQLASHLQVTARNFPAGSGCITDGCGSGIVDAYKALFGLQNFPESVFLPLVIKSEASIVPSVFFGNTDYSINEDQGTATIDVRLSEATNVTVQVDYSTGGGTATPVSDYLAKSGTLEFTPGQTSKTFSVTIVNNNDPEPSETVGLSLSNPKQATLGSPASVHLTILDDDVPPDPIINGDFESGPTGWTQYSANSWDLILQSGDLPVYPYNGDWAVWLGGDMDEIGYISQQVIVPEASPYFTYWHWIDSEDDCGYDHGGVVIDGTTVVDVYDLCDSQDTLGWTKHVVYLSAYANQNINIQIRVETDDLYNSNLFVDNVSFEATADAPLTSPGSAPGLEQAISRGDKSGSSGLPAIEQPEQRLFTDKERQ